VDGWVQLTGNREKNKKLGKLSLALSKRSLLPLIPAQFKTIFQGLQNDEILIKSNQFIDNTTLISFSKIFDQQITVQISFPCFNEVTNNFFKSKPGLLLKEIFTNDYVEKLDLENNAIYTVEGEEEQYPLFKNGKAQKIQVEKLKKGICLTSINLRVKLDPETGVLSLAEPLQDEPDQP
jgi:hypothetical protein